jgi:hypothetical protein
VLVTFTFSVTCANCGNHRVSTIDLADPQGGISGFTAIDGSFTFVYGDVDGDGRVTSADALITFQIALGLYEATPEELCRADANRDGIVTTSDALCVFQEALGIPNSCFDQRDLPLGGIVAAAGKGTLEIREWVRDRQGKVGAVIAIENGATPLSDLQFELLFDPDRLAYLPERFTRAEGLQDCQIADDNLIAPGRVRFGALDWERELPPGYTGDLVILWFKLLGDSRPQATLSGLQGGIAGFSPRRPGTLK